LARAIQLVVELRVLELRELERERFVENQKMHALRQQHAQQRLAEIDAALHGRDQRREHAEREHELERARVLRDSRRAVDLERGDDGVDDQLADVGHAGGQQASRAGQDRDRDREPPMRRPDERERAPSITPNA